MGPPIQAHEHAVTALAFSPSGLLASGAEDASLQLWDLTKRAKLPTTLEGHDGAVAALAFSADSDILAAGYRPGGDGSWHRNEPILVWRVGTGAVVDRLDPGLTGGIASVALSSSGLLASAGADHLAFGDVEDWQYRILVEDPSAGPYTAVAFSADGRTLASSAVRFARGDDRTVVLWSMPRGSQRGEPLSSGRAKGAAAWFRSLAFSPNGELLVGGGEAGVQLWDVSSQEPLGGRLGAAAVSAVAVSPDGRHVLAGDSSGVVETYPATTTGWLRSVCAVVSRNLTKQEWASFVGSAASYERTCRGYSGEIVAGSGKGMPAGGAG
jgi:WD40 repeat protein